MDVEKYKTDPAYRRKIDGNRKGGKSRSAAKLAAVKANVAKSHGRPRKDGLAAGWQARGLSAMEAETEHRWEAWRREATRQQQLMKDLQWPLKQEWEYLDRMRERGIPEADERRTEAWIEEQGGQAALALYREWRDVECKNLQPETVRDHPVPDYVLKLLCRYRLRTMQLEADAMTADEFAI